MRFSTPSFKNLNTPSGPSNEQTKEFRELVSFPKDIRLQCSNFQPMFKNRNYYHWVCKHTQIIFFLIVPLIKVSQNLPSLSTYSPSVRLRQRRHDVRVFNDWADSQIWQIS